MMQYIKNMIDSLLNNWGVSHDIIIHLRLLILLVILILLSYLAFWITKKVVINYIYKIIRHTPVKWDDILADQHNGHTARLDRPTMLVGDHGCHQHNAIDRVVLE